MVLLKYPTASSSEPGTEGMLLDLLWSECVDILVKRVQGLLNTRPRKALG